MTRQSTRLQSMLTSARMIVVILVLLMVGLEAVDEKLRSKITVQSQAMRAWANRLSESDYNVTNWDLSMNGQPQNYFEHYIQLLSDVFNEKGAKVNFVMIGACDGTHDRTIRERYLPNPHWRGVFVEPFQINFQDLKNFMTENKVLDRTHLLNAAATLRCDEPVIKMKRPTFEEKNKSLPHWMRRQIGAIVPFDKLDRPATGGWTFEYVPCVNGNAILTNWSRTIHIVEGVPESKMKLRPHVLKVDVEGHDFEVLMGFITDRAPAQALPLLISFEAKSIMGKVDELRVQMAKRGYAVSNMANDGFALLKSEFIFGKNTPDTSTLPAPPVHTEETASIANNIPAAPEEAEEDGGEDNSEGKKTKKRRRKKGKKGGNKNKGSE